MSPFSDIFISYGRADSQRFAVRLKQRLIQEGLSVWLDLEDIPKAVDYQQQIDDDIEKAHNFLFVMSPHSVNSSYCRLEIERAVALRKRIIPLLHVAEISQAVWQQRHPQGTLDEWLKYQAEGLCFGDNRNPNLPAVISKLNWLPFADNEGAFDETVQALVNIVYHHQDYVCQHTNLLVRALAWERQQRQSRYLLVAEERQQAETWLRHRFNNEQPPCWPTDLHCEFITESLKNARNLMSQVFLTCAETDQASAEQLRRSLMRAGLTVWSEQNDLQSGMDVRAARSRGIEEADNLIYLLSPDAVRSQTCQQELDYARSLNKRIIPVLARSTEAGLLPQGLQALHYIDLTDNEVDADYQQDESELLRILRQDETYYAEHKVLLAKALKWQRQHQNPSLLLRGYNLRYAETWLKLAQQRSQHPPTPAHQEFIAESLRQPPDSSLDVFISYSRVDSDFARQINDALQSQGKRTWFDQESIAAGTADFGREICRGIETSDNFLFVLSPKSISSPYCASEVEHAASLHKRFVTILYRPIDTRTLHPELAKVQWIDFAKPQADFNTCFNQLVRVLDTDREHVHSHTKWLQHAIEWTQKKQTTDLLLRGSECAVASAWLAEAEQYHKQPVATPLQKAFIQASCDAVVSEQRREQQRNLVLRSLTLLMSVVAVVAVGSSVWAFKVQRHAQRDEIAALVESARVKFRSGQQLDALVTSLQAGRALQAASWLQHDPSQTLQPEVIAGLHQAIHWTREQQRFEGYEGLPERIEFSPNGKFIVAYAYTDYEASKFTAKLSQTDGTPLTLQTQPGEPLKIVEFQPDAEFEYPDLRPAVSSPVIALLGQKGTVELWRSDGTLVKQLTAPGDKVESLSLSAGSQVLATYYKAEKGRRDTLALWSTCDGTLKNRLTIKSGWWDFRFSPTEQLIAVTQPDETTHLRSLDGKLIAVLEGTLRGWNKSGQLLATLQDKNIVRLWAANGSLVATLQPGKENIQEIAFSPDNRTVAVQFEDGLVQLWSKDGQLIADLKNEETLKDPDWTQVNFSPDGQWLAVKHNNPQWATVLQIWTPSGTHLKTQRVNSNSWVLGPIFSADGQWLALGGDQNGDALLLNRDTLQVKKLVGHDSNVAAIEFSPDSKALATASADGSVRLWQLDGSPIATLTGHYDWAAALKFSPDGKLLASGSYDRTVKLWRTGHERLDSLTVNDYEIRSVLDPKTGKRQPSEDMLVAALEDGSIRMWKGSALDRPEPALLGFMPGEIQLRTIYPPNTEFENDIEWSGSASRLPAAIAAEAKTNKAYGPVKLWRPDGKLLATIVDKPTPDIRSVDIQASNDGRIILSAVHGDTFFGPVQLWHSDGKQVATLMPRMNNGSGSAKLSPKGQYVATQFTPTASEQPGPIKVWLWGGSLETTLQPQVTKNGNPSFTFVGNFPILATWSNSEYGYGPVQLWQLDKTSQLLSSLCNTTNLKSLSSFSSLRNFSACPSRSWQLGEQEATVSKVLVAGSENGSETIRKEIEVSWHEKGQVLATSISSLTDEEDNLSVGPVQVWRPNGTLLATLTEEVEKANSYSLNSTPDGKSFVLALSGPETFGPIVLWDRLKSESVTLTKPESESHLLNTAFSADSQHLITAMSDGPVRLWSRDGRLVKTLIERAKGYVAVFLSPDQTHILISQNSGRSLSTWDRQGNFLGSFDVGHKGDISAVLFSPDGSQIATSSWDRTIKLWTLQGQLKSIFADHSTSVLNMRFTADGNQLVSVGDGTPKQLILRNLESLNDLDLLLDQGCQIVTNYLQHSPNTTEQQKHLCEDGPKPSAVRHALRVDRASNRSTTYGR